MVEHPIESRGIVSVRLGPQALGSCFIIFLFICKMKNNIWASIPEAEKMRLNRIQGQFESDVAYRDIYIFHFKEK